MKFRYAFYFICLLLVYYATTDMVVYKADSRTEIQASQDLYNKVIKTRPSRVNAKAYEDIIKTRLGCFDDNYDFTTRMKVCNKQYALDIIKISRKTIQSRPRIGTFISYVTDCPIVSSICKGTDASDEECIQLERQCIDFALDNYWRGVAFKDYAAEEIKQ